MNKAGSLSASANGTEIQVLSIATDVLKLTSTVTTARGALPTGATQSKLVRVAAAEDCYIRFGTDSVNAANTDTLFPAGVEVMQVPLLATHMAVIRVGTDGPFTVTALS